VLTKFQETMRVDCLGCGKFISVDIDETISKVFIKR